MKNFDVQSVGLSRSKADAFSFIADPKNLPIWTNAFTRADAKTADLVTPNGSVAIQLETVTNAQAGTVDWIMTFPDGTTGAAYSRITPNEEGQSIYSFVLMAPPVPLEALEGALTAQIEILGTELLKLQSLLSA